MHSFVKTALLSLCLVAAALAADQASEHQFTRDELEGPEVPDTFSDTELIDTLPSEIDRDPNPTEASRIRTSDEEGDRLHEQAALQMTDNSESELAYWRDPRGKRMCDAYAVGDPHFRSFDGQIFHFQGVGQFELVNCANFAVQARNSVCGQHGYYGKVACWNTVAVKYTDANGNTDVVEVTTRAGYERYQPGVKINGGLPTGYIKINGSPAQSQTSACKLKNKCDVVPVYVSRRKRVYIYCPDGNQAMVTDYAVYVRRPCGMKCAPALLGDDDGKYNDDYVDLTGKDYDSAINSPNRAQDIQNKIDNNSKKPLHFWGKSFMVDDKKIKSFFADKAAAFNHPEIKPAKVAFQSEEMKKKAHDFCYDAGCSYAFYQDCMMDAAETNSLDIPKKDVAAAAVFANMEKGDNHHDGKVKIAKILGKMEMDVNIQRDNIAEALRNEAKNIQQLGLNVGQNEKEIKAECTPVEPMRHEANKAAEVFDEAAGEAKEKCKAADEAEDEFKDVTVRIQKEDALIRSMLNVLAQLVNVKSVEDLDIDHAALNSSPKLKAVISSLIQESRHHNQGQKGNTDRIRALLVELLYKMEDEVRRVRIQRDGCKKKCKDADDDKDRKMKHKDLCKARCDNQEKRCGDAKGKKGAGQAKLREAQANQANNAAEKGKELKELRDECDMIHNLQDVMKNWSKKGPMKKCPTATTDLDASTATGFQSYDEIDSSIPVMSEKEREFVEEREHHVDVDELQED